MARKRMSGPDSSELMRTGERFDVRRDGVVLFNTEYPSCYPDRERRDELRKAGYKLYLGGKMFRETKT